MAKLNYESYPKYVVFRAEDTYSELIWDDEDVGIGDIDSFWIGDKEYSLKSLDGLKEWFYQADKYDPFSEVADFQLEGMEEWINKGYYYALQVREMLPENIGLYYSYWHQFGDEHWKWCKAWINNRRTNEFRNC